MPSLKDLRNRISSVKSMQRITSAMKMVAAAKLRRAQELAVAARPYAERMERMLTSLAGSLGGAAGAPPLLAGTGHDQTHLLLVITTDRGLCGSLNSAIVRFTRQRVVQLEREGKTVKLSLIGRKAVTALRRDLGSRIIDTLEDWARPAPQFERANAIAERIAALLAGGQFDVCTLIYSRFVSALTQKATPQQLVPFALPSAQRAAAPAGPAKAIYEYEPSEEEILTALLPRNLAVQIFRAMLENFASEQGARMTAMDSATRNARDLINRLTITYNRSRQAAITKELIEIISGAEAL